MELVECKEKYWEFVRELRTNKVNQAGFMTKACITYEDQVKYMNKNYNKYKICLLDKSPVGYVGIINNNEITYCVHPHFKGKGVGTFMLKELIKDKKNLIAFVKPENIASNKIFEKLGFKKTIKYNI